MWETFADDYHVSAQGHKNAGAHAVTQAGAARKEFTSGR